MYRHTSPFFLRANSLPRVRSTTRSALFSSIGHYRNCRARQLGRPRVADLSACKLLWLVCQRFTDSGAGEPASKLEDGEVDEDGDVDDAPISLDRGGRNRRPPTAAARARSATSSSPRSPSGTCPTPSTSSGRSAATTWGRRSLDLLSKLRYSGARESQITHSSARSQPHASKAPRRIRTRHGRVRTGLQRRSRAGARLARKLGAARPVRSSSRERSPNGQKQRAAPPKETRRQRKAYTQPATPQTRKGRAQIS